MLHEFKKLNLLINFLFKKMLSILIIFQKNSIFSMTDDDILKNKSS